MTDVEDLAYGMGDQPREKWQRLTKEEGGPVAMSAATETPKSQTVRVSMDKLDELLDDVGELVISRSRLLQKSSSQDDYELRDITALIDKLTSNIQDPRSGDEQVSENGPRPGESPGEGCGTCCGGRRD
jgi:chemotaxis protein histidine kinase CheA